MFLVLLTNAVAVCDSTAVRNWVWLHLAGREKLSAITPHPVDATAATRSLSAHVHRRQRLLKPQRCGLLTSPKLVLNSSSACSQSAATDVENTCSLSVTRREQMFPFNNRQQMSALLAQSRRRSCSRQGSNSATFVLDAHKGRGSAEEGRKVLRPSEASEHPPEQPLSPGSSQELASVDRVMRKIGTGPVVIGTNCLEPVCSPCWFKVV